jgi:predicted phage terminase large subunit-like protein
VAVANPKARDKAYALFEQRHFPDVAKMMTRIGMFRSLPPDPLRWLTTTFPSYFQNAQGHPVPFAAHHEEFWRWLWALKAGQSAPAFIAIWSRGGGKSASVELSCACMAYFGLRRYGLYISNTQTQADDHVQNVASMLEMLGIERQLNKYGFSRGWRVNRLRTADGFTLDAMGMDAAMRGVRLDESRPDILCLDDLDDELDSALTIQKKIKTLTRKILPIGSPSMTVLGVQNIPNADGIFAQLADGRAEFLLDRLVSGPHPALRDLPATDWWTQERTADGTPRLHITAGVPTWAGQGTAECEVLLNMIGIPAFLVECQHRTDRLQGTLFHREWFPIVHDWPRDGKKVRCWDFAGTEEKPGTRADPDWTAGALVIEKHGQYWIVDMQRARLTPKGVQDLVSQTAQLDGLGVDIWLEQEPGSSGKTVVDQYAREVLRGFPAHAKRSTGSKAERAKPLSSAAEARNVFLVAGAWNAAFLEEAEHFPVGTHDDQVDAVSAAVEVLTAPVKHYGTWGRP